MTLHAKDILQFTFLTSTLERYFTMLDVSSNNVLACVLFLCHIVFILPHKYVLFAF